MKADIHLMVNQNACEIVKEFKLYDYSLDAERYNKFIDFLLIASQIPYNSFELLPEKNVPEENVVKPKPR
jgi:hypothetical protein